MKIYKWNGEKWCVDDRSVWRRLLEFIVWRPDGTWSFFSVLGHSATYFGHWAQLSLGRRGWLVVNWRDKYAYVSVDGTPGSAHVWLWGAPQEVTDAVTQGRYPTHDIKDADEPERLYS